MGFLAEGSIGRNHASFDAEENPLGLVEQKDLNHEVAAALFKRLGD
jgi:hypothetical protein